MIYSNAVIRKIRPHLKTCISNLMTEHEDVEIGRCFFRHTGTNCNVSRSRDVRGPKYRFKAAYDSGRLFFQNWAKHVKPGGVGYKSDIDPINDLTNTTIDNAVIMHAVKVSNPFNGPFHNRERSQEWSGFEFVRDRPVILQLSSLLKSH